MPLRPKPKACEDCPAYRLGKGFVPATGPPDATIAIIGQGPGEDEAYSGIPFYGRAGRRLNKWLRESGLDRLRCHISNIVWCQLPGNRPPTQKEVDYCRTHHWGPSLRRLKGLRILVPVGLPAAKALLGRPVKMGVAGSLLPLPDQSYRSLFGSAEAGPPADTSSGPTCAASTATSPSNGTSSVPPTARY